MTQKELTELQQMTGLTTGAQNNNAKAHNDLEKFIGKFVKYNGHGGMVDSVCGARLGFIWSDKDSWTGCLADVEKVEVLTKPEDVQAARLSAENYLLRERESLKARIARKFSTDSQAQLQEMLDFVVGWINRLGK